MRTTGVPAPQGSINIATERKRGSVETSFAITANGFSDVQNKFICDGVPAMDLDSYNFAFSPASVESTFTRGRCQQLRDTQRHLTLATHMHAGADYGATRCENT